MDTMETHRLESSTSWCPVQCHSCGAQERVPLAGQDGVDVKSALAARVKVISIYIFTVAHAFLRRSCVLLASANPPWLAALATCVMDMLLYFTTVPPWAGLQCFCETSPTSVACTGLWRVRFGPLLQR